MRKNPLVVDEIYHIFTKSIAEFRIFRAKADYRRLKEMIIYYKMGSPLLQFSIFNKTKNKNKFHQKYRARKQGLVEIIAYCFMPTHLHLILKQSRQHGISIFMANLLNSYSRYFNIKTKRKGPLWQGRFENVLVETTEQLLHLTRYIHLNPVTAHLVDKPEDWEFSSYREFMRELKDDKRICDFSSFLDVQPKDYRKFVASRIDYQRKLAEIKKLFLE